MKELRISKITTAGLAIIMALTLAFAGTLCFGSNALAAEETETETAATEAAETEETDTEAEEEGTKKFDMGSFWKGIDVQIAALISSIEERVKEVMPEGYEGGGSFFSMGDTIARKVDDKWEFSTDGGETWDAEAPEGFEMSEDGTKFRFGGGEEDLEEFDIDEEIPGLENNSTKKNTRTTVPWIKGSKDGKTA